MAKDFFNNTKPVLVIHNNTMHYSFEIEIDDFANSWYLHVNDANCEYTVDLVVSLNIITVKNM